PKKPAYGIRLKKTGKECLPLDIFGYAFMQRALLVGILIGSLCAVVGIYVVLRGLSFMGAGISHAAFGGVALGYLLKIDPVLTSIFFCICSGLGIAVISKKSSMKEDTAIGIFFASTMAFGILLIGLMKGSNVDLFGYLFGNILAVTSTDLFMTILVEGVVLFFIFYYYKELLFLVLDSEMAEVSGIPVTPLYYLLIALIALTVVISIKVVGIVLVSALLVIPSATALQLTDRLSKAMILAVVLGVGSCLGGLFLSYLFDTPSGATIVLTAGGLFILASVFSPRKQR
ncbi:MAG: metal ABC transporter permease, partial [Candidatus Atribacteria bacterium]|nr:metal ABC transporter permease [Candidatus Atribacteria bacterium]